MERLAFDTNKYKFKETVQKILEADLTDLETDDEVFDQAHDQSSKWHKKFYANQDEFLRLYHEFIEGFIKPLFQEKIVYQKVPTFRVQLKNNVSVGEFHRDRDYNHNPKQINYFLPFTDTNEENTIWIESEEGKEDYQPQLLKYGEILVFNGANLKHGNKINRSGKSRVSVDFRVIPLSRYQDSEKESIHTKTKFNIGGYFTV